MKSLPHKVDRNILIEADRETVFSFFTDNARWASWWGTGSSVDSRPGGSVRIQHSNGFISDGQVLEVQAPERFVFTFSLQGPQPVAAEESRVTILLEQHENGTMLRLTHELADPVMRDLMVQGWRFHFSLFANAVSNYLNAGAPEVIDAWFALWIEPDASVREAKLAQIASRKVRFRDRYSRLDGIEDVVAHTGAAQKFMPGIRLERRGDIRHCQGTVLADWVARSSDGKEKSSGTSVFVFVPNLKIDSVTSLAHAN